MMRLSELSNGVDINSRLDALDRAKTGRIRCIGCGRFVKFIRRWNQCPDCDTRWSLGRFRPDCDTR
jgi:hypothetical protein